MKFLYKITLLTLLIPSLVFGMTELDKPKHEKSKSIKKEFNVSSDAKVDISNRYGNINVTTWDRNEVNIEVVITVKGNDLEDVEERLDDIDVEFNSNANLVEAKTIFGGGSSGWSWWRRNNRKKMSMKINYTVKMPKSNRVNLNNDYGNIYLDEIMGKANINCDYGKIELGKLMADGNSINLDYCSSSNIEMMKSGSINADYSKLNIGKSEEVSANIDYTTLKFEEVDAIDFNADYGGVTVNSAAHVKGNTDYTTIRLGTISKSATLDADYGAIIIKKLTPGFEKVDIETQFASVRIGVDPNVAFSFEVDTQYSGFKSNLDGIEYFKKISKTTKKYYEGKYGSASNAGTITIKAQYGGISINEY
ncbi:MAG: hypothetical protein CMB99_12230 [Flavobacteriaceae bacterium]|nr:hypothetical protein [Flavobacteriaceae bacterium]|tara:strand:- start:108304 stop:109395 length:1092 start_codon:yes stop_codon:yes gene_type:complete